MPKKIQKKSRQSKAKKSHPIFLIIIVVVILGFLGWIFLGKNTKHFERLVNLVASGTATTTISNYCPYHSQLNGACVTSSTLAAGPVVAVMIENHVAARPQMGLSAAAIVYEAPVEANYTRFLALFPLKSTVKKVGPVRSARPYYLDWAAEWGKPMYMHVGGSPDALDEIVSRGMFDVNEIYRGNSFWRSTDREAPHNTYTSSELWQKAWTKYNGGNVVASSGWVFSTSTPCATNCVSTIVASFLPPAYEATWKYVSSTDHYARYQMGAPHTDADGTPIMADTIIIQRVQTEVLDEKGRLDLTTVDQGEAILFRNGNMEKGMWRKKSSTKPTEWFRMNGEKMPLNPGKIWIEVVPQNGAITFK